MPTIIPEPARAMAMMPALTEDWKRVSIIFFGVSQVFRSKKLRTNMIKITKKADLLGEYPYPKKRMTKIK
jgi:hypothetical protein